jgi:anti-anti-sigma regulatory factor
MSETLTIELPSVPDRESACSQAPLLLAAATEAGDIILDAERVERLSTLWAQVIAATALEARRTGASLVIQRPSSAFTATFQDLGLDLAGLGPTLE